MAALAAPGPRVTNARPGRPVSLPQASAMYAAPPSCRQMMNRSRSRDVVHGVEDGEVALAGNAESEGGALREQAGDEDFAARTGGHGGCRHVRGPEVWQIRFYATARRRLSYNRRQPDPARPHAYLRHHARRIAVRRNRPMLAIITMRRARPLRKGMVTMVVLMALGLAGSRCWSATATRMDSRTLVVALREVALLVITFALVRIGVIFLFEVLLRQAAVPRMMADVLLVVTLLVYAIFRMNEIGVNLASLITTSAVLTGAIAFSMQAMLGNLWGGIALQADNTCRIGDWIRVDGVVGQIIGIRWRCLAVATNDGETVMMPNAQLVNSRVTVLARRGDLKIPWRRPVEFFVSYDTPPSRVIAVGRGSVGARRDPERRRGAARWSARAGRSTTTRSAMRCCTG